RRSAETNVSRQKMAHAGIRAESAARVAGGELCRRRGEAKVAREREPEGGTGSHSVHGCNHRLRTVHYGMDPVANPGKGIEAVRARRGWQDWRLAQIETGAEAAPGTGDDHNANRVIGAGR